MDSQKDLEGLLKGAKERLQLWRSSSARAGADAALTLIMSWHEEIELEKIETLRKDGAWNTDPDLIPESPYHANNYKILQIYVRSHRINIHTCSTKEEIKIQTVIVLYYS